MRELLEKRRGDERVFIAGRGAGWQMKPGQTPYRTRRAVNEVTGAAKPHGVIHRCIFNRPQASLVREGLRLLVKRLRRRGCTQGQCIGAIFAAPMEEIGTWDNGTDVALTPRSTWVDCEEECVDRRA
jgi:hypothetical protein